MNIFRTNLWWCLSAKMTLRIQQTHQLLILRLGKSNRLIAMIFISHNIACKRLTTFVLEPIPRRIPVQLIALVNNMPHSPVMSALWPAILGLKKNLVVVTRFRAKSCQS